MPSAQQTPRRPSLIIIHNSTPSKKDLRSPLSPKSPRSTTTTTFVSMISPTKIEVRQSRRFSTVSERTLTKNGRAPLPLHRRSESIVIKSEKDYNDRCKVMSPSAGPATEATSEDTFPASTYIPSDPLSLPASRDRRNSLSCVVLRKEAKGSIRSPPSCRTPTLGPRPSRRASIVVVHHDAKSTLTDESESEDEEWKKDIGKFPAARDSTDSYTWSITRV